jgi:hypothetical protein
MGYVSTMKGGDNDGGMGGEAVGVASTSGRRRGGWGGGRMWRRTGALARGRGGGGLLREGEGERRVRPGGHVWTVGPGFREGEKEKENQFRI